MKAGVIAGAIGGVTVTSPAPEARAVAPAAEGRGGSRMPGRGRSRLAGRESLRASGPRLRSPADGIAARAGLAHADPSGGRACALIARAP
ncbi:hypothetical protein TBS_26390 [Thermobispora bispora]